MKQMLNNRGKGIWTSTQVGSNLPLYFINLIGPARVSCFLLQTSLVRHANAMTCHTRTRFTICFEILRQTQGLERITAKSRRAKQDLRGRKILFLPSKAIIGTG